MIRFAATFSVCGLSESSLLSEFLVLGSWLGKAMRCEGHAMRRPCDYTCAFSVVSQNRLLRSLRSQLSAVKKISPLAVAGWKKNHLLRSLKGRENVARASSR